MISTPNFFGNLPADNTAMKKQNQKSDYYLLIGVNCRNQVTDEIDFVNLPLPVGLDTMRPKELTGTDAWQERIAMGNDLLASLQQLASELAPGEQSTVDELVIKVCRRTNKTTRDRKPTQFNLKLTK